jgi:hypothetical protein
MQGLPSPFLKTSSTKPRLLKAVVIIMSCAPRAEAQNLQERLLFRGPGRPASPDRSPGLPPRSASSQHIAFAGINKAEWVMASYGRLKPIACEVNIRLKTPSAAAAPAFSRRRLNRARVFLNSVRRDETIGSRRSQSPSATGMVLYRPSAVLRLRAPADEKRVRFGR